MKNKQKLITAIEKWLGQGFKSVRPIKRLFKQREAQKGI